MNPKSKGWLKEYLEFRLSFIQESTTVRRDSSHPDHSIYQLIQPTGLMYGLPVNIFDHPQSEIWDDKDKMKILLAESLMSSSLLFQNNSAKHEELSVLTNKALESITDFYTNVFPELKVFNTNIFGGKRTALESAERMLDKRIERTVGSGENFWTRFFQNSILFLDIYIFGQWIYTNANKIVSDFFKHEKNELRTSVVKMIAAAAHANSAVEYEERKMMEYFLQSFQLSHAIKKEWQDIFDNGVLLEEMNLPINNSWVLKKYFLEIAILTIWADKRVEASEMVFLKRLAAIFSFSEDDLDYSLMAIEGFVLEHWDALYQLQDKKKFDQVSDEYVKRMTLIADKNRSRVIKGVQESEPLMTLLTQARSSELTQEQKLKMQKLLIEVLRSVPSFGMVSLPKRFLTLPVLMQILPKNFIGDSLGRSINR